MPTWLTVDEWDDYLPTNITDRGDIRFLVSEAERELIQHYTRRKKDVRFRVEAVVSEVLDGTEHLRDTQRDTVVMLRYYDPGGLDEIDTSDPQRQRFVDAMRSEVAAIVRHYDEQEGRKEGVTSQSQGSKSVSYESGDIDRFPDRFGSYLQPFDLRPKTTHI
jgi:hypothetical protein